ncbi:MAG: type II toxin-antitoxin system HicB family antitoxin [Desulfobacterales bacterium]|nr:type II toxin-antitoxin system HicB family antitoxin [Desulfobacterales bacterium]
MMNFIYPAKIEQDEAGFFLVTFRDFPFAATDGKTLDEAVESATDCLEEAIASCIENGEDLPVPSKLQTGEIEVLPHALLAAKAALYIAAREKGYSKTMLAAKLGVTEKVGRRLLDPHYQTRLPKLENALNMLGRKLVVGVG